MPSPFLGRMTGLTDLPAESDQGSETPARSVRGHQVLPIGKMQNVPATKAADLATRDQGLTEAERPGVFSGASRSAKSTS
jgi:hypothetical protein